MINSILDQSLGTHIVIVDNSSGSPQVQDLARQAGATYRTEPRIGLARARIAALELVPDEWSVVFVDDDNILDAGYVRAAVSRFEENPDLGMLGGRIRLPAGMSVPAFARPLLPYLAVRDLGDRFLMEPASPHWTQVEPVGAGMCISATLVPRVRERLTSSEGFLDLGRRGRRLASHDDAYIARIAFSEGMKWGYDPNLQLVHEIDERRLTRFQMARLLYAMGKSDLVLTSALGVDPEHPYPRNPWEALRMYVWHATHRPGGRYSGLRFFGQIEHDRNSKS